MIHLRKYFQLKKIMKRKIKVIQIWFKSKITAVGCFVGPPKTEPVVAEEDLTSLWEQFKPDHCGTVVCDVENSAWGQRPPISPVVAETDNRTDSELDQGFTWTDFELGTVTWNGFIPSLIYERYQQLRSCLWTCSWRKVPISIQASRSYAH